MSSSISSVAEEGMVSDVLKDAHALLRRMADSAAIGSSPTTRELAECMSAVLARAESAESDRASLLQQQAALRTVISSVPHFVFWKDQDCVYRGCNDIFAALGGLASPEEIVGKTDYDMPWTKEQSDLYREDDLRVIRGGKPILDIEETNLDADGNEKVILTSKVPLQAEDGSIIGMLGIFADISARKQLEKDLSRSKELAEAANGAKDEFLAAMSHELRTPLTLILSPLESLLAERRSEVSAPVAEVLERLYRNAYRLKILTDDILDFSKHQAGHLEARCEPVAIAEHLEQLVLDMLPAATARGLDLKLEPIEDSLGTVQLDIPKFDKILINLVGNALKFTPAGGQVSVSAKLQGSDLLFAVRDTGIGIDAVDHERLFRRFEQVDASSTRRQGGTGLGLSLVKEFAKLMGGSVRVDSELGKGATFSVLLPRTLADAKAVDVSPKSFRKAALGLLTVAENGRSQHDVASRTAHDAPRVVVAEDSPELRAYISDLLGAEFRVTAVADGQAAYDAILHEQPDVVVSDVMMPVMDGFELVAKIKGNPELATIPVLLLTARAGAEASADSLNRGADDYLSKPFNALELMSRVRAAHRMKLLNSRVLVAERRAAIAERLAGLGQLLAKLSHELNNPVNVLYNGIIPIEEYCQALIEYAKACDGFVSAAGGDQNLTTLREALHYDFITEDMPGALSAIREAASRVKDVQANLSLFLGRTPLKPARGDINELVQSSLELIRRSGGSRLKADVNLGEVPTFEFDRARMSQVLLNLLKNATEAAGADGQIAVETTAANGLVRIVISDDGPGVPRGIHERIFEPFFTTKDVGLGTGLGLAISAEVVAQHGGSLVLDAEYEHGARFVLELPTSRELAAAVDAPPVARKATRSEAPPATVMP